MITANVYQEYPCNTSLVSLFRMVRLIRDKCDLRRGSRRGAAHLGARVQVQWCRLEDNLAVDPLGPHPQTVSRGWKVKDEAIALGATRHKEQRLEGSTAQQN